MDSPDFCDFRLSEFADSIANTDRIMTRKELDGNDSTGNDHSRVTVETAASTAFSFSESQSQSQLQSREVTVTETVEKKKKKEKKSKDKKSSRNGKSKSSKSSKSNSLSSDGNGASQSMPMRDHSGSGSVSGSSTADYSQKLFAKMLQDAYGDDLGDFGNFDGNDPFESMHFEDEDWGVGSNGNNDGETQGNSSRSNSDANQASPNASSTDTPQAGVSSNKSRNRLVVDMNIQDMFAQTQVQSSPNNDHFNGNDSQSILSDLTGLAGAFRGVPKSNRGGYEEDQEDPDLPIIMEQLLRDCPPPPVVKREEPQVTRDTQRPWTTRKSCLSPNCRPMRRAGSILSSKSRASSADTSRVPVDKNLRFSTVSIRHYERILTENPSTIQGPSIGIGWRFQQDAPADLDQYETFRGPPLPSPQLVLSRQDREQILTALGVTQADMAAAIRNNLKTREQRRRSVQSLSAFAPLETAVKKLWNPFGGKSKA